MSGLTVRRHDRYFAVFRGADRVSGLFCDRARCEDRMDVIARQERVTERPCIRCRTTFRSEGPHHRMCQTCRTGGTAADVPGSTGGKVLARTGVGR